MNDFDQLVSQYLSENPNATRAEAEAFAFESLASQDFRTGESGSQRPISTPTSDSQVPGEGGFLTQADRDYYRGTTAQDGAQEEYDEAYLDSLAGDLAEEKERQRLGTAQDAADAQNTVGSILGPSTYSLESRAANIGRYAGMEGSPQKALGLVGSIGSFALGTARTIASNAGVTNATKIAEQWARDQKLKTKRFTPAPQTRNANNTGGTFFQEGGTQNTLGLLQSLSQFLPDTANNIAQSDDEQELYGEATQDVNYMDGSFGIDVLSDETFDTAGQAKEDFLGGQNRQKDDRFVFAAEEDYTGEDFDATDPNESEESSGAIPSMQEGGQMVDLSMFLSGEDPPEKKLTLEDLEKRKRGASSLNKKFGDREYLLERYNERIANVPSRLAVASEDGAFLSDDTELNTASQNRVTLGESIKMANAINRRNKREFPGQFKKVKANAFVNRVKTNEVVSFLEGGTMRSSNFGY